MNANNAEALEPHVTSSGVFWKQPAGMNVACSQSCRLLPTYGGITFCIYSRSPQFHMDLIIRVFWFGAVKP